MNRIRMLNNKELLEERGDARYELLDVTEELAIHRNNRPSGKHNDIWLGTLDEWKAELASLMKREGELEAMLDRISREMTRRDWIRSAKSKVAAHSEVDNVVFLEDIYYHKNTANRQRIINNAT